MVDWFKDYIPPGEEARYAKDAMCIAMVGILTKFIEEECGNPELKTKDLYTADREVTERDGESYYRNIRYAYYSMNDDFKAVINEYWWWNVEYPRLLEELVEAKNNCYEQDPDSERKPFSLGIRVKEGAVWPYEDISPLDVFNHLERLRLEHLKTLGTLIPLLWV